MRRGTLFQRSDGKGAGIDEESNACWQEACGLDGERNSHGSGRCIHGRPSYVIIPFYALKDEGLVIECDNTEAHRMQRVAKMRGL